ncbi:hypothetical protein NDU88_006860 [Pleurodeles waltl]|uniref:Uncharacterized protein n=1 Tax=Pleurodeles waltl TaxID=8319 RepID=A0AAV7X2J2_PLEWA|nr:hypothetical protein NDU88_006860 [Pleurodeles waltl]
MGAPDAPQFVGCGGTAPLRVSTFILEAPSLSSAHLDSVRESAGPPLDLAALPRCRPPVLGLTMVRGSLGRPRLRHPRRAACRPAELVS